MDLSWSPDDQHLLLVSRRPLAIGGEQTRLLWLPLRGGEPRELLALPGQVVPSSYTWEPSGRAVAFLSRPAAGPQTAVCLLEPETTSFSYLGDLVDDGGARPAGDVAPVTWDASGKALYVASAPPVSKEDKPLLGLRPIGGSRTTLGVFRQQLARGHRRRAAAERRRHHGTGTA